MAMSTTTGGRGLRAPLRPLVHVGGGVDRRAIYHEEQAALREALELQWARRRLILSGRCQLW